MSLQENLHALYLLDSQVRGLRSRLDAATRRHTALGNKLAQFSQQRSELDDQIKHAKAHATALEKQSNDLEDRINKLREQMTQVKNNKEYSALLVEVNTLKLDKGQIEEQALTQLTQVDDLQARLDALVQQVEGQQKLVENAEAEVQQHKTEVGERLAELTAERDEAAKHVPADIKQVFERLADTYDGESMAAVVEESRRNLEYVCGGCFMSIPVERVNALYTKPDVATICPNCGRLMYLPEELKAGMGVKG